VSDKPPIRLKFRGPPPSKVVTIPPVQKIASKPKLPPIGTESISVKCGHTITLDLYAKDPFRDGRRAKAVSRDCPVCRQARAQAEVIAAADRKAQKKVAMLKPRLPDGSRFVATYDATATRWTGTLTIEGATLEQGASSLSKLLHKLDDAYRASLSRAP